MFPYPLEAVPDWCRMPPAEHEVAGGCWGISYGKIAEKGEQHCLNCEYHELKPIVVEKASIGI